MTTSNGFLPETGILGRKGAPNPFLNTPPTAQSQVIQKAETITPIASTRINGSSTQLSTIPKPSAQTQIPATQTMANTAPQAATGPSTGKKLVEIAQALYQRVPSGATATVLGAVAGYALVGGTIAVIASAAFPHIAKKGFAALMAYLAPAVIKDLQDAGLSDQDIKNIDISALTAKMHNLSADSRQKTIDAFLLLKENQLGFTPDDSKALIASPNPLELASTMGDKANVFLAIPCKTALIASATPAALAHTFELLMAAQILDKGNNVHFVAGANSVDLESIVGALAKHGVLTEEIFAKVNASPDLKVLAAGLQKLEAAGLMQKEKGMFSTPGLLDGITGKGDTNKGECFLAVMNAPNPEKMADGLLQLEKAKCLHIRANFEAVKASAHPVGRGYALAEAVIATTQKRSGFFSKSASLNEEDFKKIREHQDPTRLAAVLKTLNDASAFLTAESHLLTKPVFDKLIQSSGEDLQSLTEIFFELTQAGILDATTLNAVLNSNESASLAKICSLLQEVDFFDKNLIKAIPKIRLAEIAIALKFLKERSVLSPTTLFTKKRDTVGAIFQNLDPINKAKIIEAEYRYERNRQVELKAAIANAAPGNRHSEPPLVQAPSLSDIELAEKESAAEQATLLLQNHDIIETKLLEIANNSEDPVRMARAIIRLKSLQALTDANLQALVARDKTLVGKEALYHFAGELATKSI